MNYFCRSSNLAGVDDLIRNLDGDPELLLQEAGLTMSMLDSSSGLIPCSAQIKLLECAAAQFGSSFALMLARQQDMIVANDLLGLFAYTFSTQSEAQQVFIDNYALLDQGGYWYNDCEGGLAWFGYRVKDSLPSPAEQLILFNLCKAVFHFRKSFGRSWNANTVHLTFALEDSEQYRHFFDCPVVSSAEHNAIVYPAELLDRLIPDSNPAARSILKRAIDSMNAPLQENLVELSRELIVKNLPFGEVSQATIAELLGVSSRTLHRRLLREGTGFREVLLEARMALAKDQLQNTNRTVGEIADYVGYKHASGFCQAFSASVGCTPGQWRQRTKFERL